MQLGASVLGGIFANKQAKKAQSAANEAAQFAYEQSRPQNYQGMFGGYDTGTGEYLNEDMQAMMQQFMDRRGQTAAQIQDLNPLELQQSLYNQQLGLLAPEQERQSLAQESRLLQQGRLGSTGGAGQMQALQEAQGQQRLGLLTGSYSTAQGTLDAMRQREMMDRQAALGIGNLPMQYAQLGMNLGQAVSPSAQYAGGQAANAAVGLGGVQSGMWSQLGTKLGNMNYGGFTNPWARQAPMAGRLDNPYA